MSSLLRVLPQAKYYHLMRGTDDVYERRGHTSAAGGLCEVFWHGETGDGRYALILELHGPSIEELYRACDGTFSTPTLIMLSQALMRRFEFIHSRGIIHRDVKPQNFLIRLPNLDMAPCTGTRRVDGHGCWQWGSSVCTKCGGGPKGACLSDDKRVERWGREVAELPPAVTAVSPPAAAAPETPPPSAPRKSSPPATAVPSTPAITAPVAGIPLGGEDSLVVIDFGLARAFHTTAGHVPFKTQLGCAGTARYASRNMHKGYTQSRRDDLEAVGYMLIFLHQGRLPWQGIKASSRREKHRRICELKQKTPLSELCHGMPRAFIVYMQYVRRLRFDEDPDYRFLHDLFRNAGLAESCDHGLSFRQPAVHPHRKALGQRITRPEYACEGAPQPATVDIIGDMVRAVGGSSGDSSGGGGEQPCVGCGGLRKPDWAHLPPTTFDGIRAILDARLLDARLLEAKRGAPQGRCCGDAMVSGGWWAQQKRSVEGSVRGASTAWALAGTVVASSPAAQIITPPAAPAAEASRGEALLSRETSSELFVPGDGGGAAASLPMRQVSACPAARDGPQCCPPLEAGSDPADRTDQADPIGASADLLAPANNVSLSRSETNTSSLLTELAPSQWDLLQLPDLRLPLPELNPPLPQHPPHAARCSLKRRAEEVGLDTRAALAREGDKEGGSSSPAGSRGRGIPLEPSVFETFRGGGSHSASPGQSLRG